jgi:hypothetical protein
LPERWLPLQLLPAVAASLFTAKTRLREFRLNRSNGFVRVCEFGNARFSSPQIPQRFPPKDSSKACLSSCRCSGVAFSIVRLMISRNSDRGQIMNAPREHDFRNQDRFQGWIENTDVFDYGEPSLPPIQATVG